MYLSCTINEILSIIITDNIVDNLQKFNVGIFSKLTRLFLV